MKTHDALLFRQLQVVRKIIEDETWLEAERRGCPVANDDERVRENVCRVILRIGREMRANAMAVIEQERAASRTTLPATRSEAA